MILKIKDIIDQDICSGKIKPENEEYFRWRYEDFQYTDKGVNVGRGKGEYITKPSWFHAIRNIGESLKQTVEFEYVQEQLNICFKERLPLDALNKFTTKFAHNYLYNMELKANDIDNFIENFFKDLREEPVRCGAIVELDGIFVSPISFEVISGITLRQTKIEDIENEHLTYAFMPDTFQSHPSAILEIEIYGRQPNELQLKVWESIAILRLFRVGSVRDLRYRMYSDSITSMIGGTVFSGRTDFTLTTYLIADVDVPRLQTFWKILNKSMPRSFYDPITTELDYLIIAYNRYCDSLLRDGISERRISNAIMGLEALFLKSVSERQELSYRLSLRASKLLSVIGFETNVIKTTITDAYNVRSQFVHGGTISHKDKNKIELQYKNINNFILQLLDYLRYFSESHQWSPCFSGSPRHDCLSWL